jgi:hypothetical protein
MLLNGGHLGELRILTARRVHLMAENQIGAIVVTQKTCSRSHSVNVADRPAIRASATGSMCRNAPHGHVMRTRKSPKQSSSRLM